MRQKIAFVGAGSQADAVFLVLDKNEYKLVGYFDDKDIDEHDGFPVIGKINSVGKYLREKIIDKVFITIGDNEKRKEIFEDLYPEFPDAFINIVSPYANVLTAGSLRGRGIFIGADAFVGAKVTINNNTIVNTGAVIEHHTEVGNHVNVAPSATINGLCTIHDECYIGSGSVIIQVKKIVENTTIGAGAVVVKDILTPGTYIGVPAKRLIKEK